MKKTLSELISMHKNRVKHKKSDIARQFILKNRNDIMNALQQGVSIDAIVAAMNEYALQEGLRYAVKDKTGKTRYRGINITATLIKKTLNIK